MKKLLLYFYLFTSFYSNSFSEKITDKDNIEIIEIDKTQNFQDLERKIMRLNSSLKINLNLLSKYKATLEKLQDVNQLEEMKLEINDTSLFLSDLKAQKIEAIKEYSLLLQDLGTAANSFFTKEDLEYGLDITETQKNIVTNSFLKNNLSDFYASLLATEKGRDIEKDILEGKVELYTVIKELQRIKTGTPYPHSLKLTKESLRTFQNNLGYLAITPLEGEWLVMGKGFSKYSKEKENLFFPEVSNKVNGGIATFEYGLKNNLTWGLGFGGDNQNISISSNTSVKGSAFYLATYLKKRVNNLALKIGSSYQLSDMEGQRGEINSNYKINSYNLFMESRYTFNSNSNLKFEPKVKVDYFNITQDSIKEKESSKDFLGTLKVNKANKKSLEVVYGMDISKITDLSFGQLNTILSIGVLNNLKDDNTLRAHFSKEDSKKDFEISTISKLKTREYIGVDFEFLKKNGFIYSASIQYEISNNLKNSHYFNLGLGYKF